MIFDAHAVDTDYVSMTELRGGLSLPHKAVESLVVRCDTGGQHLESNRPFYGVLPRLIHHPHPPAPDLPPEGVVAEGADPILGRRI